MSSHRVIVDGEVCDVTCNQTSKTVWTAVGDCNGKPVEAKGSSQSSAVANWKGKAMSLND